MRRDIFLHFLNRDSREIFNLYNTLHPDQHARLLRKAINAAAILCEDRCVLPPGFVIEDEIAFRLAETQKEYLTASVLQFPIRESNLAEYAEKKRTEYYPLRNRYSGLFDDTRLGFIGRHANGLIKRKIHIAEQIVAGWQEDTENPSAAWKPVKKLIAASNISKVSKIPARLADDGTALTWSAIEPLLPNEARSASSSLRNALQHTYFRQYAKEFSLWILQSIPYVIEDFFLPRFQAYDYQRLSAFLSIFNIDRFLLESPAQTIVALRQKASFIGFVDAYVGLAQIGKSMTDLKFNAGIAFRDTTFDWNRYATRNPYLNPPTEIELLELDHAFREAADALVNKFGLPTRASSLATVPFKQRQTTVIKVRTMPAVLMFVALQEELDVLTTILGFTRNATSPMATGRIGDIDVDVICPKNMGRVPAAVESATYLQGRKNDLPKLILVLGLAGGFPEEQTTVGHIICPDTVVDLANRKVRDDEKGGTHTKFRRRDFPLDPALKNILSSDHFDKEKWIKEAIDKAEWPPDRRPSVHHGLIASVDEVVSSDQWRAILRGSTEKLLGVEMEAGGVAAAAERFKVPVCMLRAVSDHADPAKTDDKWRRIGMKTICILLQKLPFAKLLEIVEH